MARAFRPICLITVLALVLALGAAIVPIGYTQAAGGTYYVDASVGGPGSGTSGDPWKTITTALATVSGGDPDNPDVINVAAGTYDAANGETFPLAFDDSGVTLQATGAATIDGGNTGVILDVNADGIVIDGFTITNATGSAGINVDDSDGGFSITNNAFTNMNTGIVWDLSTTNETADYTINDVLIDGNDFTVSVNGVYIDIDLDFDDTVTGLDCDIGDFDITDNLFILGGEGVYINEVGVGDINTGTVTIGNFDITDNQFYDGSYGVDFYGYLGYLTDSTATVGDVLINDNIFDGMSNEAVYLEYFEVEELSGTTDVTLGDTEVNDNTIDGGDGIYLYMYCLGYYMYDTASLTVGSMTVDGNTIDADYGVYVDFDYTGYELDDDSSMTMGNWYVSNNTIDADYEALYFYFEDFAYDMYNNASFTMGDINVTDNTANSTDDYGLYIQYYDYYVASYMEDDSYTKLPDWIITGNSFETYDDCIYFYTYSNPDDNYGNAEVDFSGFLIDDNTCLSSDYGGIYMEYDDLCETTYGNSVTTAGDITITNNTFNVYDEAIYIELDELGYDIYESASLTFGDVTITGNTINDSDYQGIYLYYEYGADTYDTSTVTVGDVTISENDISSTGDEGIYVEFYCNSWGIYDDSHQTYGDITIADNIIDDCPDGILVEYYLDVEGDSPETLTLGELDITGNEVSNITSDDGIDLEYGLYVFDDVTLNVGRALFQDNTVTNCASAALDFDMYIYADSTATVNLGDPVIDSNTLEDSSEGINFWGVQNAEVTENEILNNEGEETCGVYIEDSYDWWNEGTYPDFPAQDNVFRCNNFEGNEPYGLENNGTGEVDAEGNWWGDESGPSGEGPGDGDAVSENVDYEPWLSAPCGEALPPVAAARANPPMGQAPHVVQFYDMSTGDIDTWFWSFGDGSFSDAQYPVHTYQNEGTFEVCLTVEGPGGEDTVCMQVLVEPAAGLPNLVVRNLYISATQAQPGQQVMITADVFNEGTAWGDGEIQLLINGYYEQSAQVGISPGTSQPISFTVYKVTPGEYQVVVGNAMGTFYVVEEQQPSQVGGIPMDSGTLIALIVIGVFVIAALVVAIVVLKPS